MPKVDQATYQDRKMRVFLTLRRFPNGLTEAELEQATGLQRRTVHNYLRALEIEGKVFKDGIYWVALPFDELRLRHFELSPEEAMTLYLATRLLAKQHDKRNESAETALMKLAAALKTHQIAGEEIHQAAQELARRPYRVEYHQVFRAVMQAYIYRRVLHITYEPLHGKPFETDFAPYLIEPSAIGFATYVIGHSSIVNAVRTYKLERIQTAALTRQEYIIPREFRGLDILKSAWSVIYGENLLTVVLRFSPNVRKRVEETRWHFSEDKREDPDKPGYLRWEVQVADTTDMLPWIRGWGGDVEVLEPKELREEVMQGVQRMTRMYNLAPIQTDPLVVRVLRLWGKTTKDSSDLNDFHPVVFHMLDVGNIARELLGARASPRWRNALARALNAEAETLADWLPYLVALHDIGKISAAFQMLNEVQAKRLEQEGFALKAMDVPHPILSQIYLETCFSKMADHQIVQVVSEALGGHHGQFIHPDQVKKVKSALSAEHSEWHILRQTADNLLRRVFFKGDAKLPIPANVSSAIMALTGFTILCDWLGSDGRYFRPAPNLEFDEYVAKSQKRAQDAVRESGLTAPTSSSAPINVEALLADLLPLRDLQRVIDDIPANLLQSSSLTIIEAPTGEGKTEAALALAHRIAQVTGTDELYYALPTMATSNQMFVRLQTHLWKRLRLDASVKLVHGQAFLIADELRAEMPIADIQPLENGYTQQSQARETLEWFNLKKRALIAPFSVGTIDQAELAALNVKHSALRMMGLVGKVVIVDEVHAYDTYMTTIIERLLRWLATMGTSVILLSATLPKSRRKRLAEAYGATFDLSEEQENAYPSVLVLSTNGTYFAEPKVWQPNRTIELHELHFGDDEARAKAEWLLQIVENGGCACWMTNTVHRAQRIFAELLTLAPSDMDLQLLHSQFPLEERQRRENELNAKYGRTGKRPVRGIVVGTQVLEQSLDLDFDVMVSDLAPMDLLLQRAGRLHRHTRERPAAHDVPRLWVNWEKNPDGSLKIGTDRSIYNKFLMRQTLQTLTQRTQIQLPNDYRALVEAVYSDKPPSEDSPLYDAWQDLRAQEQRATDEAKKRLLPRPHERDSFAQVAAMKVTFEEDENRADWIVAQTRLGERILNVIPLERDGDWIVLSENQRISVNTEPSLEMQRKLLRRYLRISHPEEMIEVIQTEEEEKPTELFKQSSLLKNYYPLWLTNGTARLATTRDTFVATLDPQLGLIIEKEGKANDTTK